MAFKKLNLKGRTTYNHTIIDKIVYLAVSEIEGVAPALGSSFSKEENPEKWLQKMKLDIEGNNIYVDISINMYEGFAVPDVAFKVQEVVKNGIENMTAYKVLSVNVTILNIVS